MQTRTKAVLVAALAVAAVYAGLKSYVYYQARAGLDQLTQAAAPFATIEYGAIGSTLWSGRVAVRDLRITPVGMSDVVTVGEIALEPGSLWRLLALAARRDARQPPESLALSASRLALDLDGELMRMLDGLAALAQANAGAPAAPAHCGGQSLFGPAHLRKLGYQTLVSDLRFAYRFDRAAEKLRVQFDGSTHDLSGASVELTFAGPLDASALAGARRPRLAELGFKYRDLSYTDRLKRFCAQAGGRSVQDYVDSEVEQLASLYRQLGIVPGPGLRQAYRDFLTAPGEIALRVRPSPDFSPEALPLYSPDDIVAMLDLSLQVNGRRVDDLSFSRGLPETARAGPPAAPAAADAPPAGDAPGAGVTPTASRTARPEPGARPQPSPAQSDGFRTVRVAELGKQIGRPVRLQLAGGQLREGVLAEVAGATAVLERRFAAGGSITVKVALDQIVRAEVSD